MFLFAEKAHRPKEDKVEPEPTKDPEVIHEVTEKVPEKDPEWVPIKPKTQTPKSNKPKPALEAYDMGSF